MNYSAEIAELKGMVEALTDAIAPLVMERKEHIESAQRLAEAAKDDRLTDAEASGGIFIDACGIKRDGNGVPVMASDADQAAAKAARARTLDDEAEAHREYQTRGLTPDEINMGVFRDQTGMLRKKPHGEFYHRKPSRDEDD